MDGITVGAIIGSGASILASGIVSFILWGIKSTITTVFTKMDSFLEVQTKILTVLSAQDVKNDNIVDDIKSLKEETKTHASLIMEIKSSNDKICAQHAINHPK